MKLGLTPLLRPVAPTAANWSQNFVANRIYFDALRQLGRWPKRHPAQVTARCSGPATGHVNLGWGTQCNIHPFQPCKRRYLAVFDVSKCDALSQSWAVHQFFYADAPMFVRFFRCVLADLLSCCRLLCRENNPAHKPGAFLTNSQIIGGRFSRLRYEKNQTLIFGFSCIALVFSCSTVSPSSRGTLQSQ